MLTKKSLKTPSPFECKKCDYICYKQNEWNRHIATRKHINIDTESVNINMQNKCKYICECGKEYAHRQSLSLHKKKCNTNMNMNMNMNKNTNMNNEELQHSNSIIFDIIKQNQEFKELIVEQNKKIIELSKNNSITTNTYNNLTTNNNKFNLNFFLNEQCKDALNITDFMQSIKLSLTDLENMGTLGFINGISNIFVKELKQLDVYKRPIHCSDLKRETIYVKDENIWEKENEEKDKFKKAIKHVAHKNMKQIFEWADANPSCKKSESCKNDQYMQILSESMISEEGDDQYNKIIKNVAKEVMIDK